MAKKKTKKAKPRRRGAKSAKKKAAKNGRPTKYKPKYCKMLIDFFDIEPYTDVEVPHYEKSGKLYKEGPNKGEPIVVWVDTKRVANRVPTLRNFAKKIGIGIRTIFRWLDENDSAFHREFRHAFTRARELRKWFLIENGLNGCFNPVAFKFVAINETDMEDASTQEITGPDGGPIPLKIVDFAKIDLDKLRGEN